MAKGDLILLVTGRDPITEDKLAVMPSEAEARRQVAAWAEERDVKPQYGSTAAVTEDDTCAYMLIDRETGRVRYRHANKTYLWKQIRKDLRQKFFVGEFAPGGEHGIHSVNRATSLPHRSRGVSTAPLNAVALSSPA